MDKTKNRPSHFAPPDLQTNNVVPPSKTAAPTKTKLAGHNREYDVTSITVGTFKALMDAINVTGGVLSKPKKFEKVKPPLTPVKGTYDLPDYLHESLPKKENIPQPAKKETARSPTVKTPALSKASPSPPGSK